MNPQELQQIKELQQKYGLSGGITNAETPTTPTKDIVANIMARTKPKTGFMADIRGIGTGIKEDFDVRAEKSEQIRESKVSPLRKLTQLLGQGAGLGGDVIGQTLMGGAKALTPQPAQEKIGEVAQAGVGKIMETEPVKQLVSWYQELPEENKRDVDAVLGFASLGGYSAGAKAAIKGGKAIAPTVKKGFDAGVTKGQVIATKGIEKGKELITGKPTPLTEVISPKITARETRNIVREGRVTQPKESIIFGKQPDMVEPTVRIKKAADIITEKIPTAKRLDQYQLANAIEEVNTNTAKSLKPKLKTVQIQQDTTQRIKNAWDTVKKTQADNPEFSAFAGSKKAQQNFEVYLNVINKRVRGADGKFRNRDLNDLWELRKKYDSSISESVKRANSTSAPSTQLQHDMWLQNRDILNEVIEEMSENLPKNARKSFEEMNLLYEARTNLINKAKLDLKGKEGMFTTKNAIKVLIGATASKFLIFN